jgi:hypothetical protein
MSEYTKMANDFAKKHNVKLHILGEPEYGKYFTGDKQPRYIFKLKVVRNKKSYTFKFGQSINEGYNHPDLYSVLACLTKYDVGTYDDFISEFGYDVNFNSQKIYKAVCKEYEAVERLFGDVIEELSEIC